MSLLRARSFSSAFVLLAALLASSISAQQPKVLAPHKPVPPLITPPQPLHDPPVPRSLVGGLWMTDANMKSYLHITNDLITSSLSVTPVLWLSNGTRLPLPPVTLEPSGTTVISVNQSLADQGLAPYATLSGYVELDYQWPWDALCATVRNIDITHSVIFNYGLPLASSATVTPAGKPATQTLEGLWWKQEPNVTGFVALANPGRQPIPATLIVEDALGQSLAQVSATVSPHGTKMLDLAGLPQTAGSVGGLRLQFTGADATDLLVSSGLRDDATGYSANINFVAPPAPAAQTSNVSYAQLGLMTGTADPMLNFPVGTVFTPYSVARNISAQPITITPHLWWMAGGVAQSATLSAVTFAPMQSQNLNVPALLAQVGLKDYNGSVNLVLNVAASAPRGAVLLNSGSVDQRNDYVFQVASAGVRESMGKSLSYWSTANGDDTMVTLWNPADEPQDFVFTLSYSGGRYLYPIHLEPRATQMLNISEITHTGTSDSEANIIPAGVHEGSAQLSGSEGEAQRVLVAFDASVYNVQKATCGWFCETCQGAVNYWILANPFAVAVNGTNQLTLTVQNHTGTQVNDTSAAGWSSSNNSIASVSSGLVNGLRVGAVNMTGSDDSYPDYVHECSGVQLDCPIQQGLVSSAPGNSVAIPVNFRQASVIQLTDGGLQFTYYWDSSSGNTNDLSNCQVGEIVYYPGTASPYHWTQPPYTQPTNPVTINPFTTNFSATNWLVPPDSHVGGVDSNIHPPFVTPYTYDNFTTSQTFRFQCTNYNNGNWVNFNSTGIAITRDVTQNANGSWKYTITKSGASNVVNPMP